MTSRDDEDALSWEGDDDPTLEAPAAAPAPDPTGDAAPDAEAQAPEPDDAEDPAPAGLGNVALIAYGVLGGLYALWTVGWILGSTRLRAWVEQAGSADVMFTATSWLAILAPAVWFAAVLAVTRGKRQVVRFLWLGIGAVLLIPWPFLTVGILGVSNVG